MTVTPLKSAPGVATVAELDDFERFSHIALPEDYRVFLLETNGGSPSPDACWLREIEEMVLVDVLFGLNENPDLGLRSWLLQVHDRVPRGFLPIGKDPGGNLFLMETIDSNGAIHYWDAAGAFDDEDSESESGGQTYAVAECFDDFLAALVPLP